MKKRRMLILAIVLVMVATLSTFVSAYAYTTCVQGKEHLNAPNSAQGSSWYVNLSLDKCGKYVVNWDHAWCYARAIFPEDVSSYPSQSDSGRVWNNGYSEAYAYGKGTLQGYYGHDCNLSY